MKRVMLAFLCAMIAATSAARAGTTGVLSGTVVDITGKAVAEAQVLAVSPAQGRVTTSTDAQGHFVLLNLAPDTYTVSIEKRNYEPVSYAGVVVFADTSLAFRFRIPIAYVTRHIDWASPSNALVREEVGGDYYTLNTRSFDGFPNPVGMALTTIPGISTGSGGAVAH